MNFFLFFLKLNSHVFAMMVFYSSLNRKVRKIDLCDMMMIWCCVDGTAGTSSHAISMKHLLRKQVLLFSSLVAPSPT
jgi:hypothetical protein